MFFQYGQTEIDYLKSKDTILGAAIDKIGYINRPVNTDLFSSILFHIIGQQISSAAHKTVWERMTKKIGSITPNAISLLSVDEIQQFGMTFRKAGYIKNVSEKIRSGDLNLDEIKNKNDSEVIAELSKLNGVGQWTAEMIMIFCLQRPDILSYNDLAIHRGLRTLYRRKNIDKKMFEKYRQRYSPCNTVASLYLWAVAADPAFNT